MVRLEGEKSLPSQQLGSRFLVYLSQTNIDQSRGGIRPAIPVFPIRIIPRPVLIGGGYKDLFTIREYIARPILKFSLDN